jgi:hypothetical protein
MGKCIAQFLLLVKHMSWKAPDEEAFIGSAIEGPHTHSHGSEPIHENGKRERAPALMRGIADRDESRSAGLSIRRRRAHAAIKNQEALGSSPNDRTPPMASP